MDSLNLCIIWRYELVIIMMSWS